ncbi:MAG: hypothetical protein FWE56_04545 [Candidatus Bathyarchaeota archaeon]|nr:hypothetical protein [Candidatus Termiticorpusculum sp.]MCL2868824.1 hypothetical protein [Candidatus Termiticorpusculum sp.]
MSENKKEKEDFMVRLPKSLGEITSEYLYAHKAQAPKNEQYTKEELEMFGTKLKTDPDIFKIFVLGMNVGVFLHKHYGDVFITNPKEAKV